MRSASEKVATGLGSPRCRATVTLVSSSSPIRAAAVVVVAPPPEAILLF